MTLDNDNARLIGDFAKKLRDPKYREVHIYYSPIDYYIIRPEEVINVEVRDYTSQRVIHVENNNWDLDLPTSLIGTVVWQKKSEIPEQHPLTKALNNLNYRKITVSLNNHQTLEIPAAKISKVDETGRTVNVYMRNGDLFEIDLKYFVSMKCECRIGKNSEIYDNAIEALEKNNWTEGVKLLSNLTYNDPTDYDAFYRLGYAQIRNKKPTEALTALDRSLELNPFIPRTWLLRSKALQDLGQIGEAESYLQEAITKFPEDIDLWMELSSVYTDQKKYDIALETQNKVLELDPDNDEEWEYLAFIAEQKGDIQVAIDANKKVLELSPEESPIYKRALQGLGCRYCHNGDIPAATKIFNSLIEKFPEHSDGWDVLSCIARRTQDYDLAEKASRKAIEINPEESSNWASLGYSIYRKDLKQAEEVCRKSIKMNPDEEFNWTALATVLFVKNDVKEAIKANDKAEQLGPDSATNMYNIASGYSKIQNTKKVLHYLRKALELDRTQVGLLKDDRDFDFLRENEEFIKLKEEYSK
jgi:tetratricopeptide (TPR) repeat protein